MNEAEDTEIEKAETVDLQNPEVVSLVNRLYWRRFARQVRQAHLDPDDGLQEVWLRLLRKLETSPFNPARACLSTYLYLVLRSSIADWMKSEKRREFRDGRPGRGIDAALLDQPPVQLLGGRLEGPPRAEDSREHALMRLLPPRKG